MDITQLGSVLRSNDDTRSYRGLPAHGAQYQYYRFADSPSSEGQTALRLHLALPVNVECRPGLIRNAGDLPLP